MFAFLWLPASLSGVNLDPNKDPASLQRSRSMVSFLPGPGACTPSGSGIGLCALGGAIVWKQAAFPSAEELFCPEVPQAEE